MKYGALRRKIGGTYNDFFKSYVDGTCVSIMSTVCLYSHKNYMTELLAIRF